jgi:uncharacterized membrane protein YqjE
VDTVVDRGPPRSPNAALPPPGAGASARLPPASSEHEGSILEPLERALASMRRMVSNYTLLGVLDARRAAIQFAWLIAAGIFITVLAVTAWLAIVVALAVLMLGQGMSWPAVLGVAALLNLVGAGIVAWRVKHVFDEKPFAATLRQLKSDEPSSHNSD